MLQFRIQSTPNPTARKYIINEELKASGKVSYESSSQCKHVPIAHMIMSIPAVAQVHFFENVLTVSQTGEMDWAKLDNDVQTILIDNIESHDISFNDFMNSSNPELISLFFISCMDSNNKDVIVFIFFKISICSFLPLLICFCSK